MKLFRRHKMPNAPKTYTEYCAACWPGQELAKEYWRGSTIEDTREVRIQYAVDKPTTAGERFLYKADPEHGRLYVCVVTQLSNNRWLLIREDGAFDPAQIYSSWDELMRSNSACRDTPKAALDAAAKWMDECAIERLDYARRRALLEAKQQQERAALLREAIERLDRGEELPAQS